MLTALISTFNAIDDGALDKRIAAQSAIVIDFVKHITEAKAAHIATLIETLALLTRFTQYQKEKTIKQLSETPGLSESLGLLSFSQNPAISGPSEELVQKIHTYSMSTFRAIYLSGNALDDAEIPFAQYG